jgi:hypothetical protein
MNDVLHHGRQNYLKQLRNGEKVKAKQLDPMEKARRNPTNLRAAINAECFDCCGFQRKEVSLFAATDCSLWPLRPWQPK